MRRITIVILAGLILTAGIEVFGQDGRNSPPSRGCENRGRSCDPYKGTAGGVRLASDIVDLVGSIFAPRTVVVTPQSMTTIVTQPVAVQQPVVQYVRPSIQYQQPVVVQQSVAQTVYGPGQPTVIVQTVPAYTYSYYNNVYVPYYSGWYYYGNRWCWSRPGPPPVPPRWRPCPPPYSRR